MVLESLCKYGNRVSQINLHRMLVSRLLVTRLAQYEVHMRPPLRVPTSELPTSGSCWPILRVCLAAGP